ncbi:MAG: class I SAM-dependent methyltransferase [Candidatus Thermoplasmatota archaeon]
MVKKVIEDKTTERCPLCGHPGSLFHEEGFFLCTECKGIFRSRERLPTHSEERSRYEMHDNEVDDEDYQDFVSPITDAVRKEFSPEDKGLDFGAGTGPVISKVLGDEGYDIEQYDPFFAPALPTKKYDYIVCCEVIEHFHDPKKEFGRLKDLLRPNGHLYCMTYIYKEEIDFDSWGYKNDATHAFLYQKETFEWIEENFHFSSLKIDGRLIELVRSRSE